MIFPKKMNDKLGVFSCSDGKTDPLDIKRVKNAVTNFKDRNVEVVLDKNVFESSLGRSGSAKMRADEFMNMITKSDISAMIALCGGDYLCEALPYLDYEVIAKNPKWLQGYSDPTGILYSVLTKCDIATIYGSNFTDFGMQTWHESIYDDFQLLKGQKDEFHSYQMYQPGFTDKVTGLEGFSLTEIVNWRAFDHNQLPTDSICFSGRQIGGCLDVIINLLGTPYENTKAFVEKYEKDGIIWCLESFELGAAALTRTLWQLKEAGWFRGVKAFVFGRPTFYRADYDISYEEAVFQAIGDLGVPIVFDACFGHRPPRIPLVLGGIGKWMIKNGACTLQQSIKQ